VPPLKRYDLLKISIDVHIDIADVRHNSSDILRSSADVIVSQQYSDSLRSQSAKADQPALLLIPQAKGK